MIKTRGDKWSENEISLAKELYLKGCSFSDIAVKTNHTDGAITKKIQELGLNNRKTFWTDEDIDKLRDLFYQGLSYAEISEKMGKSIRSCQSKAVRIGLKTKECNTWLNNKRADFWSDEEILKLKDCALNYSSYEEISKIMGRSKKSISCKLHDLKIHIKEKSQEEEALYRRVYSVDDNYFENINTQKKAYWLGWMVTDGYVITKLNTKRGVTNVNAIGLDLQESDLSVLEELKKDIKTDVSIKYCKTKKPSKPYTNKITKEERWIVGNPQYSLRFSSAKMIQDLVKYGIHQNKTYDIGFPELLKPEFYPGFIAGVISGDGCIDIKKNRKGFILRCVIAGNLDLVQKIHSILAKEIGVNSDKKIFKYEHTAQLYRLELNQTETIALYNWFKKNGIKLMERKNKMIEDYLAEKETKAA